MLAIRHVATSSGAKTPGIDNVVWKTPEDKAKALETLGNIIKTPNTYKASPLKRIMIPKTNSNELRPLGIPTLTDRSVQALYLLALDPAIETNSDARSFGFRKFRSQHDAIAYIRSTLDKKSSASFILEADIAKCFDNISHQFLMDNTPTPHKHVLEQWLKSGYVFEGKFYETKAGTPQGGIISPLLCNLALNGLEKQIMDTFPSRKRTPLTQGGLKKDGVLNKVNFCRYADDFIVTGGSEEILNQIRLIIEEFLKPRGLELKEAKTRIVSIETGFNFLGFNICRKPFNPRLNKMSKSNQETVLIIKPAVSAIKKVKTKISNIIHKNPQLGKIILELNPLLRG
jgi:RNA-directed DNA polymerase